MTADHRPPDPPRRRLAELPPALAVREQLGSRLQRELAVDERCETLHAGGTLTFAVDED